MMYNTYIGGGSHVPELGSTMAARRFRSDYSGFSFQSLRLSFLLRLLIDRLPSDIAVRFLNGLFVEL
jgi:hypothetical protein